MENPRKGGALEVNFKDRVVLITGGGAGIGRATCLEFATAGAAVAVVDQNEQAGEETAQLVRKISGRALFIQADVSRAEDVERYVQQTLQTFGGIDVFFNNAGIMGAVAPTGEYPVDVFDRVMAINVRGTFLGLRAVLPVMIEKGAGSIVNTASVGGTVGSPGLCAYVASKHAILGLTRTAAGEAASQGVRVNAICPGPIHTGMMRSIEAGGDVTGQREVSDQVVARNPSRRYGEPEEVARVVLFLASDAASYVNGAAWLVDGGRTAV